MGEDHRRAAPRIADRVAIIDDGRVVLTGRPDDGLSDDFSIELCV